MLLKLKMFMYHCTTNCKFYTKRSISNVGNIKVNYVKIIIKIWTDDDTLTTEDLSNDADLSKEPLMFTSTEYSKYKCSLT